MSSAGTSGPHSAVRNPRASRSRPRIGNLVECAWRMRRRGGRARECCGARGHGARRRRQAPRLLSDSPRRAMRCAEGMRALTLPGARKHFPAKIRPASVRRRPTPPRCAGIPGGAALGSARRRSARDGRTALPHPRRARRCRPARRHDAIVRAPRCGGSAAGAAPPPAAEANSCTARPSTTALHAASPTTPRATPVSSPTPASPCRSAPAKTCWAAASCAAPTTTAVLQPYGYLHRLFGVVARDGEHLCYRSFTGKKASAASARARRPSSGECWRMWRWRSTTAGSAAAPTTWARR